jgi:hypothetical protein
MVNGRASILVSSAAVVVAFVVTVNIVVTAADPERESDAGLKLQAALAGRPVQEKVIGPVKPAFAATLNDMEADCPAFTVRLVAPLPTETATGASIAWLTVPEDPASFASPLYVAVMVALPAAANVVE